ncbi:uncharacterized protein LOC144385357 isoform X2 [Gasterosteus aculeatus]
MGGVKVPCLIDTGSMVSTVTESFFQKHFEPWGQERLKACSWLQLRAANGLSIPYLGYLELDVELCGKLVSLRGILVVKDPPGNASLQAPGVLGMNVIQKCYQELFVQHGLSLFNLPSVTQAPQPVTQALQEYHQVTTQTSQELSGKAKVRGRRACRIAGGVMQIVAATCSGQGTDSTVLFEPLDSGLPAGLLASPSVVRVVRGTAYIPIVNVGSIEVLLYPRTVLGTLQKVSVVSLPAGIAEVPSTVAIVASHTALPTVPDQIEGLDLSSLSPEEQGQVRSLLRKYSPIFSTHDGDLGCTNLISHDIPLLDETPVTQRYRRVSPSDYEAVKDHINQLLSAQVRQTLGTLCRVVQIVPPCRC